MEKQFLGLVLIVLIFNCSFILGVSPYGAENVNVIKSETSLSDVPQGVLAQAGNVTELNIFGYSTTQTWQGYFGNVSGAIQLADSEDNVFYNWSLANPEGEIYATVNSSVNWSGIKCFDWDSGGVSLENSFNIDQDDVDGVNETFSLTNHDLFYVNNIEISENSCMSTRIYGDTGEGVDSEFEEVLLSGGSGEVIFASIIEEASVLGFDNRDHDFQMLVLEDGHETDTSTTTYYFYVELQ